MASSGSRDPPKPKRQLLIDFGCESNVAGNPKAKRPRLIDFGRESHVTDNALMKVLHKVREEGLPDALSRSTRSRQRQSTAHQDTAFGPIVQSVIAETSEGQPMEVHMQHPLAFLSAAAQQSASFRELLSTTLDKHANELRIAIYSDEVTPGQTINDRNDRKVQALYWTFCDYPLEVLLNEDAWFTMCVMRSSQVAQLEGGLSQLFTLCLRMFFGRPSNADLRDGVLMDIGLGAQHLMFANAAVMIQDAAAHKECTCMKGAAGNKPCVLCVNVVRHKCKWLQSDPNNWLVSSASTDIDKFILNTDASIDAILHRLQDVARNAPGELEQLEMEHGTHG